MSLSTQPSNGRYRLNVSPRLAWAIGIGVVLLAVLILAVPQLNFWFSVYWGYQGVKEVLYQHLGMSDAWSTLLARALSFFYAFAWTPLLYLAYRRNTKQIAIAFVCYLFLFGLTPLLKAAFGRDICFNQMTDEPEKWYVKNRDGSITLYDSPGFNSFGVPKRPVTTEICQEYQSQEKGATAHQITGDVRAIEFFRSDDGSAKVWYDIGSDGKIRLFDGPGFDPATGLSLQPASPNIRDRAIREQQRAENEAAANEARQAAAVLEKQKRDEEQAQADERRAAAAASAEQRKQEQERLAAAKLRAEQENREAALGCRSASRCSLTLSDSGDTVPVSVPLGKNPCFDRSFWDNLDRLGYQISSHGSPFEDFPCTRADVFAGSCNARYMDRFRFRPQPGVSLPRYWFVDAGARRC